MPDARPPDHPRPVSSFNQSTAGFTSRLEDHHLVVQLKDKALDIVVDPNGNRDYFDMLEAIDRSPEVHGFIQIHDGIWNRRVAVHQLVETLKKDAEFISHGGRPYGYLHDLITARFRNTLGQLLLAMLQTSKPIVAGMHGEMSGEYLAYTLSFDARVVTSCTTFSFDTKDTGIPASPATTLLMPRYIGIGRTMSLIHSGSAINAEEALSLGLVSKVVDSPDELLDQCKRSVPLSTENQRFLAAYHRQQMLPSVAEAKTAIEAYIDAMTKWILQFRVNG